MERSVKIAIGLVIAVIAVLVVVFLVSSNDDDDADTPTSQATSETENPEEPTPSVSPEKPKKLKPAAELTEPRELTAGGGVKIVQIESVTSDASVPGEVSAPAIRVTLEVTAGDKAIDLGGVVVNAYYGKDETPAVAVSGPGVKQFSGKLKTGKSAQAVQVFNVPREERKNVTIEFIYPDSLKSLKFQGSVS